MCFVCVPRGLCLKRDRIYKAPRKPHERNHLTPCDGQHCADASPSSRARRRRQLVTMSEYERLTMSEGHDDHDDRRFRQRTLQRWRLSMLLAFASGVMCTLVVYPRLEPCPDLQAVAKAAAARCPACPMYTPPDTSAIVSKAVEQAVTRCPVCPKCPDFPGCPTCPAAHQCPPTQACPSCELKCPQCSVAMPDAEVASRHRKAMLLRPVSGNIIECAPGQDCRMGATNRYKMLGQKGATLWLTGLSGAGKTTITKALEKRLLFAMGKNVFNIDGDNLRTGLTRDLGFSASDRAESVRRASEVAQLFSESGVLTVVTLISPYRDDRDAARLAHQKRGIPFLEVGGARARTSCMHAHFCPVMDQHGVAMQRMSALRRAPSTAASARHARSRWQCCSTV